MSRGRTRLALAALAGSLLVAVTMAVLLATPAAANHTDDAEEMWVTVAINAAGADRVSVTDEHFVSERGWEGVASEAAVAIDQPVGSFEAFDDIDSAYAELDEKLARTDDRGALSWAFDTGKLQLLAQEEGYDFLLFEICTPRVRQVVSTLMAAQPADFDAPGSRCRGWYQSVEEPPIRGSVQLMPDRNRYSSAMGRTVGAAANAVAVLGIGAFLLRRGPLKRRSVGSWILSIGSALGMSVFGWGLVTFTLWWTGATADSVMLGGGSIGEQVARTMLPGLIFVVPALLPALLLLTVPRKEKAALPGSPGGPSATWGPAPAWPQWGGQGLGGPPPPGQWGGQQQGGPPPGAWGPAPAPPGPPQHGSPYPPVGWPSPGAPPPFGPPPADPPPDESPPPAATTGWAVPGSGPHV